MEKKFSDVLLNALMHFGYSILYFIIFLPFELWKKALLRLDEQRSDGSLKIANISSPYPFFSYIKRWILEFAIDALIFISYFVGIIVALYALFTEGFMAFIMTLICTYFVPMGLSFIRDLFQLFLLPIRKFLNWVNKPAQYMDLEIKNK